jgi:hypothetical protein
MESLLEQLGEDIRRFPEFSGKDKGYWQRYYRLLQAPIK